MGWSFLKSFPKEIVKRCGWVVAAGQFYFAFKIFS